MAGARRDAQPLTRARVASVRGAHAQISQLRGLSVIFSIYIWALLVVIVLATAYYSVRKYKEAKDPSKATEAVTFDD